MIENIFKDGILIDIDISYWSGAKALGTEDLGLDKVATAYKLGRKMLIPSRVIKEFRYIEGRARRLIDSSSFSFPIGGARFIPKKRYEDVIEQLKKYKDKYEEKANALVYNYDRYKEEMKPVYIEAAELAYNNHKRVIDGEDPIERDAFIEMFIERIKTYYPDINTLRGKFSLSWDVYEISMPRGNNEYQTQVQTKVSNFIEDVVKALRRETVQVCNRVASNISEGKVVKKSTLKSLKDFVDKFASLNFVGDVQIEGKLQELRDQILDAYPAEEICDSMNIQGDLKKKLDGLVESAADMTDINSITGQYNRKISWK